MVNKTKDQLLAELEELRTECDAAKAEAKAAKERPVRDRFPASLWPNLNRRSDNDPAWTGNVRLVVPADKQPGEPLWLDISEWDYNEDTSPVKFKQNPPDFNLSLSPCSPAFAAEQEAKYQKARPNGR